MPETTAKGNALARGERMQIMLDADELIQLVRSGTWRGAAEAATEAAP